MMAFDRNQALVLPFVLFILTMIQKHADGAPKAPCYFIFGDSLSDAGTNNDLITYSKADYPPYGIDFPSGATGRFTNGRTLMDFISDLMGVDEYVPPLYKAHGKRLLKGVNYASGGSGILKSTTKIQGQRVWLNKQVKQHSTVRARIDVMIGKNGSAAEHLSKCIYTVAMGSNDYINNYYAPLQNPISQLYTPDQFAALLVKEVKKNLKLLHAQGARKVVVLGLTGIGCCPFMAKKFKEKPCSTKVNTEVQFFNDRLTPMVKQLNRRLSGAKFTLINATSVFNTLLQQGLNNVDSCCKTRRISGTCRKYKKPCTNRSQHVFFDGFHPSEAANKILADLAFKATSPEVISPYTFQQLLTS